MAQTKKSPEQLTSDILSELDQRPPVPSVSRLPAIGAVLLLVILIIALTQGALQPSSSAGAVLSASVAEMPRLASVLIVTGTSTSLVIALPVESGRDDLFLITEPLSQTLENLTQSPAVSEAWPVVDREGKLVAYYGIADASIEVYVQALAGVALVPITVQAGDSGLHTRYEITPTIAPAFSPDGKWVAFPVHSLRSNGVEFTVASSDGGQVLNVPEINQVVLDYAWVDDTTLMIVTRSPEGPLRRWSASLNPPDILLNSLNPP